MMARRREARDHRELIRAACEAKDGTPERAAAVAWMRWRWEWPIGHDGHDAEAEAQVDAAFAALPKGSLRSAFELAAAYERAERDRPPPPQSNVVRFPRMGSVMARHRSDRPPGVPAYLAEHRVRLLAEYEAAVGYGDRSAREAATLEAGEPIEVYGWEVPHEARHACGIGLNDRVLVHGDGSLTITALW
jgi:hypothetical protein